MAFLRTIRLDHMLSYGPGSAELPLRPLNVLIGPNASGKSNLIDALSLLAAAPRDLQAPVIRGGGPWNWQWKGSHSIGAATVDVTTESPSSPVPLRYRLTFREERDRLEIKDEMIESAAPLDPSESEPFTYYRYQEGHPVINVAGANGEPGFKRNLKVEDVDSEQSILSQRRDPDSFPELTFLARQFDGMRFYRGLDVGRHAPPRLPQKPVLESDHLLGDASNLSMVLLDLLSEPTIKRTLLDRLRDFYPLIEDVTIHFISSGRYVIAFREKGLHGGIAAERMSDGSLRYLCLLAVLCHPKPPPVVCMEEPETGLHPDAIPEVAKLLVEASSRSQIFVATHSDTLVDALTDVPESVVVCEKVDGSTQLRRLDADDLGPWLEDYRLGELWTRGRFGGNRW